MGFRAPSLNPFGGSFIEGWQRVFPEDHGGRVDVFVGAGVVSGKL